MNRWNRPRPLNPTAAHLRGVLERLGVSLSPGQVESTNELLYLLDRALDQQATHANAAAALLAVHRAGIEQAPVALVVISPTNEIVTMSASAAALLDGGVSALLPRSVLDPVVARVISGGESWTEAVDVFGPPSRTLTLIANPLPKDPTRAYQGFPVVVLVEDTTEQRRAEMVRRDLVTNISHELRTPVGAVALLAETLSTEHDPDTMRHLASRLEHEAERLTTTLQDVLSLSRLEGSGPADRADLDVAELVRVCCAKLKSSAQTVGIDLRIERLDEHLTIHADQSLIKRAIENLLENAIKYSDKGEPVVVEAYAAPVGESDFANIAVKDTGIGIPLRERQRIFERFYRVDRARGRDTGGSGLGLAIVRHVAVSHDGQVDVESLEGVGSTFTLRIPVVRPTEAIGSSESGEASYRTSSPHLAPVTAPVPVGSNQTSQEHHPEPGSLPELGRTPQQALG
jgi:two-component system, OmpR family, sensor histidine kinase SenX3